MTSKLVIGAVLAVTLGAQTPLYIRTGGHYNGRMWKSLSYAGKNEFMGGYWTAAEWIYARQACSVCDQSPHGYTGFEVAEMLDTFYRTPENDPIPIGWAIEHLWEKMENRQLPKDQTKYLQMEREWAASAKQESQ